MDPKDLDNLLAAIPEFDSFGDALRFFRTTVAARLRRLMPGIGDIQMTNLGVVNCLNSSGYDISPSTYSELENGHSLPRDPFTFIERICPCLAIERNSLPYWLLVQHLSFDLVRQRVGEDAAVHVVLDRKALVKRLVDEGKLNIE